MPSRFRLLPHYVLLAIFTLAFPFTSAARVADPNRRVEPF